MWHQQSKHTQQILIHQKPREMPTYRGSNNFQGTSNTTDSPISSPVPLGTSLFDPTETEVLLWEFKWPFMNNEFTALEPADFLIPLTSYFNWLYFQISLSMYTFLKSTQSVKKGKVLHRIQYLADTNNFYLTKLIFECTFIWKEIISLTNLD